MRPPLPSPPAPQARHQADDCLALLIDPSTSPGILASFSQRPPFLQDFAKSSQEGAKKTTILDSFYHFPKATNLLNCGLPSKLKKTATWPNILLEAPASQSLPSSKLGFCY